MKNSQGVGGGVKPTHPTGRTSTVEPGGFPSLWMGVYLMMIPRFFAFNLCGKIARKTMGSGGSIFSDKPMEVENLSLKIWMRHHCVAPHVACHPQSSTQFVHLHFLVSHILLPTPDCPYFILEPSESHWITFHWTVDFHRHQFILTIDMINHE